LRVEVKFNCVQTRIRAVISHENYAVGLPDRASIPNARRRIAFVKYKAILLFRLSRNSRRTILTRPQPQDWPEGGELLGELSGKSLNHIQIAACRQERNCLGRLTQRFLCML